jgi:uncharacterized protein
MSVEVRRTPGPCRHATVLRTVGRVSRVVLGVLCLALGVAGLFLPFLQGILLLLVGLTLLSSESEMARRWLEWLRARVRRKQTKPDG